MKRKILILIFIIIPLWFLYMKMKSHNNTLSIPNIPLNGSIQIYFVNPNPFDQTITNADCVLTYTVTQPQYISAYIVDFDKNLTIKTIFTNWYAGIPGNTYEVHWDGTNNSGSKVKNCQYYFKLVGSSGSVAYARVNCDGYKTGNVLNRGAFLYNPFGFGNYTNVGRCSGKTFYKDTGNCKDYKGNTINACGHGGTDYGCDSQTPLGTLLYSCFDGYVYDFKDDTQDNTYGFRDAGNYFQVYHKDNNSIHYKFCHLKYHSIQYNTIGSFVEANMFCAQVDNTGKSYSNHLHFELIINGIKVCPYSYQSLCRWIEDPRGCSYNEDIQICCP